MEKKKAKVVSIALITHSYSGKNGPMFIHKIGFEHDPQVWSYHSAKETVQFKEGDVVEGNFNIEQKGAYTNYNFSPVADEKKTSTGRGGGGGREVDEGTIIMQSCIASACNLIAEKGGSFTERGEDKAIEIAKKFYNLVTSCSTIPDRKYKQFDINPTTK